MSNGQSLIDDLRRLKNEQKQMICYWKKKTRQKSIDKYISTTLCLNERTYSTIMKREKCCPIDNNYSSLIEITCNTGIKNYDCRLRNTDDQEMNIDNSQLLKKKQNFMSCKLFLKLSLFCLLIRTKICSSSFLFVYLRNKFCT